MSECELAGCNNEAGEHTVSMSIPGRGEVTLRVCDQHHGLVADNSLTGLSLPAEDPRDARIRELEDALDRLRPILQNSKDAFEKPPSYSDPSLTGWRFEGLASGCRVGLEVIDRALGKT